MALTARQRTGLGALLVLLASPSAAQRSTDLTAVLTQIEGQVTISPEGQGEVRSVRSAAPRQVIRRGERVHVPAGAWAALICSQERLVKLTGPEDWSLDEAACGRGAALPASSYRNLVAYAGRILPRKGILLLELETRNVEVGFPVLLSPRDTAVTEPYPRLVWTQVANAVEYEIVLRGAIETSIRLALHDLQCERWRDLDVCSWLPSGKWPALEPEKAISLRFASRPSSSASWLQGHEVYQIHLLSAEDQQGVQERLRQIAELPLDPASKQVLTAGADVERGLDSDAIVHYEEALKIQEMPEVRVTLGDLYLTQGLTTLAGREYRQVLAGAPEPTAQAAAEVGLGCVAYVLKRWSEAREHFDCAREIYAALGLPAEAEDARAAAARAQSDNR